jgi:hypothetical protein
MSIAAEMDLAPGRGVAREHIRHGSVTEEQRRPGAKDAQPYGFEQKEGASVVAPPLQIHFGICSVVAPSWRPLSARTAILIVL